jgi:predicted RNA polymerase sigma factor
VASEAIRFARALTDLMPDEAEVQLSGAARRA